MGELTLEAFELQGIGEIKLDTPFRNSKDHHTLKIDFL
jgi:hypothetical protein